MFQGNSDDWISSKVQQPSQQQPKQQPPINGMRRRAGFETSESETEGSGGEKNKELFNGTRNLNAPSIPIPIKPIQSNPGGQQLQKKRRMSQVPQDPRLQPRPKTPSRDPLLAVPFQPSTSLTAAYFAHYAKPSNVLFKPAKTVVESPVAQSPSNINEDTSSEHSSMSRMNEWAGSSLRSRFAAKTASGTANFGTAQYRVPVPSTSTAQQPNQKEQKKRRERSTTKEPAVRKNSVSETANSRCSTSKPSHSLNTIRLLCPTELYKAMQAKHAEIDKLIYLLEQENECFKSICIKNNLLPVQNDPVTKKINEMNDKLGFKALLLDIEGTTTSISFVKDILFPYAAQNVHKFLNQQIDFPTASSSKLMDSLIELSNIKHQLQPTLISALDRAEQPENIVKKLAANVKTWIEQDQKLTPLKQLQGLMWEEAYVNGDIKGHVFNEVPAVLEALNSLQTPIYIFSSGSVQAQKLLFQHTHYGDLTELISGYFDTNVGAKVEPLSYTKISREIEVEEAEILFATDVEKEAVAACAASLQTVLVVREGNAPVSEQALQKFRIVHSLKDILL